MNRLCKDAVSHLGANTTRNAIVRAGKVVQTLSEALHHFDHENSIDPGSIISLTLVWVGLVYMFIN